MSLVKQGELLLPFGGSVPVPYSLTHSERTFNEYVLQEITRRVDDFMEAKELTSKIQAEQQVLHRFAVISGRCKVCGVSRAVWEFSRHTQYCQGVGQ